MCASACGTAQHADVQACTLGISLGLTGPGSAWQAHGTWGLMSKSAGHVDARQYPGNVCVSDRGGPESRRGDQARHMAWRRKIVPRAWHWPSRIPSAYCRWGDAQGV